MNTKGAVSSTVLILATAAAPALAASGPKGYGEAGCSRCHAVARAGIEARASDSDARDLSGYKSRVDLKSLSAYLRNRGRLGDNEHPLSFKGSDEELQAIIDWLGSLEAK